MSSDDIDSSLFQINNDLLEATLENGQKFHCSALYFLQIYFLRASLVATQRQKKKPKR